MCNMMKTFCYAIARVDDFAIHLAVAGMALHRKQIRLRKAQVEDSVALNHYNMSVALLNVEINKQARLVTDAILGAVTNLAGYDVSRTLPLPPLASLGSQTVFQELPIANDALCSLSSCAAPIWIGGTST